MFHISCSVSPHHSFMQRGYGCPLTAALPAAHSSDRSWSHFSPNHLKGPVFGVLMERAQGGRAPWTGHHKKRHSLLSLSAQLISCFLVQCFFKISLRQTSKKQNDVSALNHACKRSPNSCCLSRLLHDCWCALAVSPCGRGPFLPVPLHHPHRALKVGSKVGASNTHPRPPHSPTALTGSR